MSKQGSPPPLGSVDLTTSYLGLRLTSPFMLGASPIADHVDSIRRVEDAGASAVVLHSLFEEQISLAKTGRIRQMNPLDPRFTPALANFPEPRQYAFGPDEYLEHVRRAKAAVKIPIVASLNGTTASAWLKFAKLIEQAGADAIELNTYSVVTEPDRSGITVENTLRQIVQDLKHELKIPIAIKLSPFFTAFASVARELDASGADALVIFNRFFQPDIDIRHLTVWPRMTLSDSSDLPLRLRWLAILRGRVRCSLAATGGVETAGDAIKALLAGADVVQTVSSILRHGPSYFGVMREELRRWMESLEFSRIDQFRGRLSLQNTTDASAFERGQYLQTLSGWGAWLEYEALARHESKVPS
jgi:dihydroorotate dehydrogenase (fumarate)